MQEVLRMQTGTCSLEDTFPALTRFLPLCLVVGAFAKEGSPCSGHEFMYGISRIHSLNPY